MSILFPTDLSEQSAKHFEFALELAKKLNQTITLVHVYPIPMPYPSMDDTRTGDVTDELINATEAAHEEKMKQFKNLLSDKYSNSYPDLVRVGGMLRMGFVGDEVALCAEEIKATFIVISVKQVSALKRFLGGSDVSAIIRKSKVPVITIPDSYKFRPIVKIAYATDLTFSDNEVISKLLDIGDQFGAQIKCFHVHDSNIETENSIIGDFIEQYKTDANDRRISFELVDNNNIPDGIDFYVKSNDIDLLVILKQKTYWLQIFDSSMTKKMVFHEDVPMLIYHD